MTLSPSAPGLPPESALPIDLRQVAPEAAPSVRLLIVTGAGTAVLFLALTAASVQHSRALSSADLQLHSWVLVHRTEATMNVARWLTWGGATVITLPALIVVGALASPRRRPFLARIGSGMLLAGIASLGVYVGLMVNAAVGGVRPPEVDWAATAGGPSFPSGHTTAATIFAAFVVWALIPQLRNDKQRVGLVAAAVAYAGIVGLSRVWLGVHWPSDVLGGWLYGIAAASLAAIVVLVARRRVTRVIADPRRG